MTPQEQLTQAIFDVLKSLSADQSIQLGPIYRQVSLSGTIPYLTVRNRLMKLSDAGIIRRHQSERWLIYRYSLVEGW